jgi:hypothetical protein
MLTSSQLAVVALDVEKIFAAEAEQRMKAGVKVEDNPGELIPQGSTGRAAEKAAAALKTSATYVKAVSVKNSRLSSLASRVGSKSNE